MFPGKIKKNKEDTKKVSFRLFKEGMKVKEIAEFRELTTGTISNHLLHYVRTGDIKLQELVDQEKINYITAHLQKFSSLPQGVKEIKEKLGEYTSYDEIRFVFEAYKKHILSAEVPDNHMFRSVAGQEKMQCCYKFD